MAKIIKKPSALKEEYLKQKSKVKHSALTAMIFILAAVGGNIFMRGHNIIYNVGLGLFIVSALGFIICCGYACAKQNLVASLKQGVDGEDITADILMNGLSDKYTVFQNSIITLDGKKSELDLIVVGENGIFVLEAKNRNGRIVGNYTKDKWTQYKIGRKGGEYSAEFYSPVKQVGTHVFRLAGFLRQNSIRAHIDGIVYFANPEAELQISGQPDKISVFCSDKELLRFIKKNDNQIPIETVEHICDLLK